MAEPPAEYRADQPAPRRRPPEPEGMAARLRAWIEAQRDRSDLKRPDNKKPSRDEMQAHTWYWLAALVLMLLFQGWWINQQTVEPVEYSKFLDMLNGHELASVQVEGPYLTGQLVKKQENGRSAVTTTVVDDALVRKFQAAGVKFSGVVPSNFLTTVLSWVAPLALLFLFWRFVFSRYAQGLGGTGGLMSIGRAGAKVFVETDTKTTFADVAGADEAKAELKEIVDFLQDPQAYGRLGAHVPKGILLVGPPGTGKTLLARAVAGEAGVPFFSISGSEFVEMFVGVGAARVRDLFHQASEKAPAIVFIDELDALGRARGAFSMGGQDEKEQTLNQLLVELDGFDPRSGVVLLAATNRPEILDPALLRAGRFDRQVLVDKPDRMARAAILALRIKRVNMATGVSAEQIAELTPGMTGADLANLINEAALLATRRRAAQVEMEDVNEAVERSVAGLTRRTRVLSPRERALVAYHEMGHALVAALLPGSDPVHKVSIIPRGVGALGYTIQRPSEDRYLMTRAELDNRMAVQLGGRAAEMLVFGEITTGAADDLQKATDLARAMVTRFGMTDSLGPAVYETEPRSFLAMPGQAPEPQRRDHSEAMAEAIDRLVSDLVRHALQRAGDLLREHRDALERTAQALMAKETLTQAELQALSGLGDAP